MFTIFENYIKAQGTSLSDDEIRLIAAAAVKKTLHRKEVLLQEGEVCHHKLFIVKGFMRTYRTGADGSEHIMQFSPELTWTTEGESYTHQIPSAYSIDALEDTEVMLWTRDRFLALMDQMPALKEFSEQLIAHNLYLSRNRIYKSLSSSPTEKYDDFIQTYPGILMRVPLRMIASYLGVSLKTLTRIRHAQIPHNVK